VSTFSLKALARRANQYFRSPHHLSHLPLSIDRSIDLMFPTQPFTFARRSLVVRSSFARRPTATTIMNTMLDRMDGFVRACHSAVAVRSVVYRYKLATKQEKESYHDFQCHDISSFALFQSVRPIILLHLSSPRAGIETTFLNARHVIKSWWLFRTKQAESALNALLAAQKVAFFLEDPAQ
jgi:hypothetical protein